MASAGQQQQDPCASGQLCPNVLCQTPVCLCERRPTGSSLLPLQTWVETGREPRWPCRPPRAPRAAELELRQPAAGARRSRTGPPGERRPRPRPERRRSSGCRAPRDLTSWSECPTVSGRGSGEGHSRKWQREEENAGGGVGSDGQNDASGEGASGREAPAAARQGPRRETAPAPSAGQEQAWWV